MAGWLACSVAALVVAQPSTDAKHLRVQACEESVMETFAEATPRLAKVLCIQTVRANDLEELAKKPAEPCPACPPPKVIRKNDVWELLMVGGLVGVVVGSVALGIGLALSSGGK